MLVAANIFQPLIDVFQSVLTFFHNSLGVPWGWAIVLLTVCVRAVLLPLTIKQFGSMQRMQQLAPEMKAIQAKYKEDKQRQQQEMMKFYKENDVHPLGSCLPLVAQLPVFISLFYMLRQSLRVDICPDVQKMHNHGVLSTAHTIPCGPNHGAGFLFIPDLTNTATGAVLVVLIILYVGTQLASSLMMSSPTMDPTQRKIMLFMPLFFVLFVINFPAGVLVYWITTNTWTMAQQYVIRRRIGPTRAAPVTATGGATSVVPEKSSVGSIFARARAAATGQAVAPKPGAKTPSRPPNAKPSSARTASDAPANAKAAPAKATAAPANDKAPPAKKQPVAKQKAPQKPTTSAGSDGNGSSGGLSGLLRGRNKADEPETTAVAARSAPPPRPPRKKKKRSGRRR